MSSGSEDFITPVVVKVFTNFNALDEIAARQGSPVTFDRLGNVIFAHDMSEGLSPFLLSETGTGDSVAVDTTVSFYGTQSLLITGGSVNNEITGVLKTVPLPTTQYIGISALFLQGVGTKRIILNTAITKGGIIYTAQIGLQLADDFLYFVDSGLLRQQLLAYDVSDLSGSFWGYMKMVVDIENFTYHRTIFNDNEIEHSQALANTPSGNENRITFAFTIMADGTTVPTAHLGSFIHTVNEPGN